MTFRELRLQSKLPALEMGDFRDEGEICPLGAKLLGALSGGIFDW